MRSYPGSRHLSDTLTSFSPTSQPFFSSSTTSSSCSFSASTNCSAFLYDPLGLFNALMRPLSRHRHARRALMLSIIIITCSAFTPTEFRLRVCEPVLVPFHILPLSCGLCRFAVHALSSYLSFFSPDLSAPCFLSLLLLCRHSDKMGFDSLSAAKREGGKKKPFSVNLPLFYFLMHDPFISPSSGRLLDIITGFNCHAALITAELSFSLHTS